MYEEFLSQFRLRPHAERADALYRRVSQCAPAPLPPLALRRSILAVSALTAGLVVLWLLSSSVRLVLAISSA